MEKPTVITVEASERPKSKSALKQMRNNKTVPTVAYGPKVKKNLHVTIPELELEKVLKSNKKTIIKLVYEDKEYNTLIQKVDFHPVTDRPLHADLFVMEEKTPVTITIPIRLVGTPQGVTEGGRLYQPLRWLYAKCLPKDIPAEIVLDISHLNIGDTLEVGAVDIEGVEALRASFRTIAVIRPPKGGLDDVTGDEEGEEGEETGEGVEAAAEGAESSSENKGEDKAESES